MGNCLVTKLKSVVNNDNLEKLNELVIKLPASFNGAFTIKPPKGCTVTCDNTVDDIKVNLHAVAHNIPFTIPVDDPIPYAGIQICNSNFESLSLTRDTVIRIENAVYENERFVVNLSAKSSLECNWFDKLSYLTHGIGDISLPSNFVLDLAEPVDIANVNFVNLASIGIDLVTNTNNQYTKILKGDVAEFANKGITFNRLRFLSQTGLYGNIASLGVHTSVSEILFMRSGITGSIESLVEALCANEKTEGEVYANFNYSPNVTFHQSNELLDGYTLVFSATGCTVMNRAKTVTVGTYVIGTGWTYPSE